MKPHEDAFGQIMLLALAGKPSAEIVERDDGYIEVVTSAPARISRRTGAGCLSSGRGCGTSGAASLTSVAVLGGLP